jgi:methionyl-tRNA synthetase
MSKSSGNVVTPDEVVAVTGPDAFRYFLLAENNFGQDGNFAWELMTLKVNADLSNDFGNLVNRSISMCRKYFPGEAIAFPSAVTHSADVRASFEKLPGELRQALDQIEPQAYITSVRERSRVLNLYIDKTKPWALAKDPANREELREVMATLLEGIRWVATAFEPVLPFSMPEVFMQIGGERGNLGKFIWGATAHTPGEPKPIFPRLELTADGAVIPPGTQAAKTEKKK